MQTTRGRPFVAIYVDSPQPAFNSRFYARILPGKSYAFVLVIVANFVGVVAGPAKRAAAYGVRFAKMLYSATNRPPIRTGPILSPGTIRWS